MDTIYTEEDVLRLAKRIQNAKRQYLLVNPLQGKHLAVRPSRALAMMHSLGRKLHEACPHVRIVIGFAETATALGFAVAEEQGDDCFSVHTTRECLTEGGNWIDFLEEHSHAMEQRLYIDALKEKLAESPAIAFVDDELSTGRTLLNIVARLKEELPEIAHKELYAVSLINRLSREERDALAEQGLTCVSLLSLSRQDYSDALSAFQVHEADFPQKAAALPSFHSYTSAAIHANPRLGVSVAEYRAQCVQCAQEIRSTIAPAENGRILCLGTEECMYPAMVLGFCMEGQASVFTHATTRSPIGICTEDSYPVQSGAKLASFYEEERNTYIYNLDRYDQVFVISDAEHPGEKAVQDIRAALSATGGEVYVWHI